MENYPKYGCPFEAGEFFHIYNSAVGKEKLFISTENYRYFLDRFHFYTHEMLSIYSFCLMSNHFHFLVKVQESVNHNSVSKQLRNFFISYSKSFNKEQRRRGSLFNKHLKRVKIEDDNQLIWTIYYIHRNPFHHKITSNYKEYPWSSYQIILSDKSTKLKRTDVLNLFSDNEQFVKFHERNIAEDILNKKVDRIEPF
jgi:REP element-mobilizing transposase RayT